MTELQIYGPDGLFHNIVKQSAIMNGRYAILPKGGADLNMNNLLSGLEFSIDKYPGVFCLPPISELPATVQGGPWESFYFRLFFMCTTNYTGDNKIKSPDFNTNTSLHTVPQDWQDMKAVCLSFMNALEKVQRKLISQFRMAQKGEWRIIRLNKVQNDSLSGVMIQFQGALAAPCVFTDIDPASVELPNIVHPNHYH